MGLISFTKRLIKKTIFLWVFTLILLLDISILVYHLLVSNGIYAPLALLIVEILSLSPLLFLAYIFSGETNVHNKTKETNKRRDYARLESRTRF